MNIGCSAETFRIVEYDPQNSAPTVDLVLRRAHPEDVAPVHQLLDRGSRGGQENPDHGATFPFALGMQ